MAIKEGENLLDSEEITLSSSELDDVLSSAEFDEPGRPRLLAAEQRSQVLHVP